MAAVVPAPVPPALPVPAATTSIFSFVGAPAGAGDIWQPHMGTNPLVQVDATEDYHWLTQYVGWSPFPAAPAAPTHYHCHFSDLEILHGCQNTVDDLVLASSPFLRYTVLSQLSAVWDTVKPLMDTTMQYFEDTLFARAVHDASQASTDSRLSLVSTMTLPVEPTPIGAAIASRWTVSVTTQDLVPAPGSSLFSEGTFLARLQDRFTHAGRSSATGTFAIMMEGARLHVVHTRPEMAPILRVHVSCFNLDPANYVNHIGPIVGKFWKGMVLPIQLVRLKTSTASIIEDHSIDKAYILGDDSVRKGAFSDKLESTLLHYPGLSKVLLDSCTRSASSRISLYTNLARKYLPDDYDVYTIDAMDLLEPLVLAVNVDMSVSVLLPDNSPQRVIFHIEHKDRLKLALKADAKDSKSAGGASSNRSEGVKTVEYQRAVPDLEAALGGHHPSSNGIQQIAMHSSSKLLYMYFAELCGGVPGFQLFSQMSSHRGRPGSYIGWLFSADDNGIVDTIAIDKCVSHLVDKATYCGDWYLGIGLYDLACTWDAMLHGEVYVAIPVEHWFEDEAKVRIMRKYGMRYFQGIGRCGVGQGSFGWVVDQGLELLENRKSYNCEPEDVLAHVQWWFQAALLEAGSDFRQQVRPDTDFSQPLADAFLQHNKPDGCVQQFIERKNSLSAWKSWAKCMKHTVKRLLNSDEPSNNTYESQADSQVVQAIKKQKLPG